MQIPILQENRNTPQDISYIVINIVSPLFIDVDNNFFCGNEGKKP